MTDERRLRMARICGAASILAGTAVLMLLPGRRQDAPDARSFGRWNAIISLDNVSYYLFIRHKPEGRIYCRYLKDPRMLQKCETLLKRLESQP